MQRVKRIKQLEDALLSDFYEKHKPVLGRPEEIVKKIDTDKIHNSGLWAPGRDSGKSLVRGESAPLL